MFLDSKESTARELIGVIRKAFNGPQDSSIADKLLAGIEQDMLAEAANRRADQLEVMAAKLQVRIDELQPQIAEARREWQEAEEKAQNAELAFMGAYANAATVGEAVPSSMFEARAGVQSQRGDAQGRLRSLNEQSMQSNRRAGLLKELIGSLRAIQPALPDELKSLIESSRFWRG